MPNHQQILESSEARTLVFAWFYPHFLESRSPALYAVASPMGVIPCTTLAAVIGLTLLAFRPVKKRWRAAGGCSHA